jgi:PAS domain-containing protein
VDPPASQRSLLMILARNLTSRLASPVWVVDGTGTVVYFNEAAEAILGRRFLEGSGMPAEEWSTFFQPIDEDGNPVPYERLPVAIAIGKGHPDHQTLTIRSADGVFRKIEATAFPLCAHADECVGAVAIFWEPSEA